MTVLSHYQTSSKGFQTIAALVVASSCKGYFDDGAGLVGLRKGGVVIWYRYYSAEQGYLRCGSTNTPQGAQYRKLSTPWPTTRSVIR